MPHASPSIDFTITPEKPEDQPAVEALIAESFGPDRSKRTVYRFREARAPLADLAFVARMVEADPGSAKPGPAKPGAAMSAAAKLVGSLNFWAVDGPEGPLPLLGPLAVLPDLRGQGVGRALVAHGLAETKRLGWPAVLIVGDPGYYAPHGFSVTPVAGLELPGPVGPLTFMGLEFDVGALTGLVGPVKPRPPT